MIGRSAEPWVAVVAASPGIAARDRKPEKRITRLALRVSRLMIPPGERPSFIAFTLLPFAMDGSTDAAPKLAFSQAGKPGAAPSTRNAPRQRPALRCVAGNALAMRYLELPAGRN